MVRYIFALLIFMAFSPAFAEETVTPYQVGDTLLAIALQDQHEKPHMVGADTRIVLYTTGMKGGGVIRDILDEEDADYLSSHNAMFISNISGMPRVIASMIALPRMRSHDYSILLDTEGDVTSRIPSESNSATIIELDKLKITSIQLTKDSGVVRAAVEAK